MEMLSKWVCLFKEWIYFGPFCSPQGIDQTEPESAPKVQTDRFPALPKVCHMTGAQLCHSHKLWWWMGYIFSTAMQTSENLLPSPAKPDQPKTPPPSRPPAPKVVVDGSPVIQKEEISLENLQAEIKELRMALELLQRQHEWVLFLIRQQQHLKLSS